MSKHTDGPWIAGKERGTVWAGEIGGRLVAAVYGDSPDCKPDETMLANARLIAAAPLMLAALQDMHEVLSEAMSTGGWVPSPLHSSFTMAWADMTAAIAAANGESA